MDGGGTARRLYDILDAKAWASSSKLTSPSPNASKPIVDGEGTTVLGGDSDDDSGGDGIEALLSCPGPASPRLPGQLRSSLARVERYRRV